MTLCSSGSLPVVTTVLEVAAAVGQAVLLLMMLFAVLFKVAQQKMVVASIGVLPALCYPQAVMDQQQGISWRCCMTVCWHEGSLMAWWRDHPSQMQQPDVCGWDLP